MRLLIETRQQGHLEGFGEHPSISVKTDGGKLSHAGMGRDLFFVLVSQLDLISQSEQCNCF